MKYRKKPVVIEAWQVGSFEQRPEWLQKALEEEIVIPVLGRRDIQYVVLTLEGDVVAKKGDWIVQGIKGELYYYKDDIFRATYDKVSEAEQALDEIVELSEEMGLYDEPNSVVSNNLEHYRGCYCRKCGFDIIGPLEYINNLKGCQKCGSRRLSFRDAEKVI